MFCFVLSKVQLFWEGHKNFEKISHLVWRYWENVKTSGRFFSNFVALSQYRNFNSLSKVKIFNVHNHCNSFRSLEIEFAYKILNKKWRLTNSLLSSRKLASIVWLAYVYFSWEKMFTLLQDIIFLIKPGLNNISQWMLTVAIFLIV